MRRPTVALTLAAACALAPPVHAQTPVVATLHCPGSTGSPWSFAVYYLDVDFEAYGTTSAAGQITLALEPAGFGDLATASQNQTVYAACTLSSGSATVTLGRTQIYTASLVGQGSNIFALTDALRSPYLPGTSAGPRSPVGYASGASQLYTLAYVDFTTITTSGFDALGSTARTSEGLAAFAARARAAQQQAQAARGAR